MNKNIPKNLSSLWIDVRTYLDTWLEFFKLKMLEKGSKIIADLVTNTVVLVCMLMAFLASAVTLAFYFSHLLDSYAKGFGCATIFFTLLAILILKKKSNVEKFIAGLTIRRYFEKHCEEVEQSG